MKEKLINIGIGVLIGVVITSIGFLIYINAKGIGKKPNFGQPPQMKQMQDRDSRKGTPPELPKGEKPNSSNDENSKTTQENGQTQSNS